METAEAQAKEAMQAKAAAETRAELAESREIAHQDRWAHEIYECARKSSDSSSNVYGYERSRCSSANGRATLREPTGT